MSFKWLQIPCPHCGGRGLDVETFQPGCDLLGQWQRPDNRAMWCSILHPLGHRPDGHPYLDQPCPECSGTGRQTVMDFSHNFPPPPPPEPLELRLLRENAALKDRVKELEGGR